MIDLHYRILSKFVKYSRFHIMISNELHTSLNVNGVKFLIFFYKNYNHIGSNNLINLILNMILKFTPKHNFKPKSQ